MDGETFELHRPAIERLGYRMLGSRADAQDIAQETYLRWQRSQPEATKSMKSWLLKTASRLAMDRLKSAQRQRESYIGPWLPEPWLVDESSPDELAAVDDSVTIALMLAMERLSPAERAAFLLHDVFGLTFDEVAEALGKTPAGSRKLAARARQSIRAQKPRFNFDAGEHRRLLEAFLAASQAGDLGALKSLLAKDVTMVSDSGGKVISARRVLETQDKVSRFFIGVFGKARRQGIVSESESAIFNGLPGVVLYREGEPYTAFSLSVAEGRIQSVFAYRNPDKLALLARLPGRMSTGEMQGDSQGGQRDCGHQ